MNEEFLSEPSTSHSSISLGKYNEIIYSYFFINFIILDSAKKIEVLNAARAGKTSFKTGVFSLTESFTYC